MALLTQVREQTTAPGMAGFQALCCLRLGEAQMQAGHLEEAYAQATRTLKLTRAHHERANEAYALRLLGDIAARRQPPEGDQASEHYRQALAHAQELGMRPLQAHCHFGLGKLYTTIGRHAEASAELSTAIELYWAMEMTLWLTPAETALLQVEKPMG